jgi:hypothetical protein
MISVARHDLSLVALPLDDLSRRMLVKRGLENAYLTLFERHPIYDEKDKRARIRLALKQLIVAMQVADLSPKERRRLFDGRTDHRIEARKKIEAAARSQLALLLSGRSVKHYKAESQLHVMSFFDADRIAIPEELGF